MRNSRRAGDRGWLAHRSQAAKEVAEMERISQRLKVDPVLVAQTLRAAALPLD
jgi:hypothetical protein